MDALTVLAVVSGIAGLASIVYTSYYTIIIRNKIKSDGEYAHILQEMLSIERDYAKILNHENAKQFDKVHDYIMKNTYLLDSCNLEINFNRFIIQEAKYSDKQFQKFLRQLEMCPKEMQRLALRKNIVIERVVKLKRPYYFRMVSLKKRVLIQILSMLINILDFIVKITPKDRKIVRKKEFWDQSNKVLGRVADVNRTILAR